MSEASLEIPEDSDETRCIDCGAELSKEEIEAGREMCFDCYEAHQG